MSIDSSPNAVPSGTGKRRAFTAAFKYELSPNLLAQWKEAFVANAATAFQSRGKPARKHLA